MTDNEPVLRSRMLRGRVLMKDIKALLKVISFVFTLLITALQVKEIVYLLLES